MRCKLQHAIAECIGNTDIKIPANKVLFQQMTKVNFVVYYQNRLVRLHLVRK